MRNLQKITNRLLHLKEVEVMQLQTDNFFKDGVINRFKYYLQHLQIIFSVC